MIKVKNNLHIKNMLTERIPKLLHVIFVCLFVCFYIKLVLQCFSDMKGLQLCVGSESFSLSLSLATPCGCINKDTLAERTEHYKKHIQ